MRNDGWLREDKRTTNMKHW